VTAVPAKYREWREVETSSAPAMNQRMRSTMLKQYDAQAERCQKSALRL
jgi:hypothetical protein